MERTNGHCPQNASRSLIRQATESGINFFGTANIDFDRASKDILDRALRDFARREEVVIAIKLNSAMRKDPNAPGCRTRR